MEVGQTFHLGLHHQRLDLPVKSEALALALAVRNRLPDSLDLDFSDHLRCPLRRVRLGGAEDELRGRLREHYFGKMAVDGFELGLPLVAKDDGIVALAALRQRGMELRKTLEAGQLIDHQPHLFLTRLQAWSEAATPASQSRASAADEAPPVRLPLT